MPSQPLFPSGLSRARSNTAPARPSGKLPPDVARRLESAARPADPVALVLAADRGRLPGLLPLRHGRMVRSAFTFYRGSALAMAADLASTPVTGIRVQCCGDAHLCNFGGFATPERRVIFSINDLDETLPGPWEWDVKRLAASFVVACRDNGLKDAAARDLVMTCVRTYRESMAEFSEMKMLELWYFALDADEIAAGIKEPGLRARAVKRLEKERAKSIAEDMFPKLVEAKGEKHVIKDQLPTIFHARGYPPGKVPQSVKDAFAGYRDTLASAYRSVFDRYDIRDAANKVVGIGSVGTSCWVLLLMTGEGDPLFLQVKEARASVLEPYAGATVFRNHGQRVVDGYRLMQPASDVFLGWSRGIGGTRDYYIRQLRDVKITVQVESFGVRRDGVLRHLVRKGSRPLPRPVRESQAAQRLHGQERHLRSGHRDFFDGLRRPEREGLCGTGTRRPAGQGEGGLRRGQMKLHE